MKRLLLLYNRPISCFLNHYGFSQETYVGYKPLSSFQQDTISYLQYNWGLKAAGMCYEMELSVFFSRLYNAAGRL